MDNHLIPLPEEEDDDKPQRVYSYEEKRLKSLIQPQGYEKWEKEHRSWEIENRLIPLPDEEVCSEEEKRLFDLEAKKQSQIELLLSLSLFEEDKKEKDALYKRIQQLPTKPLTEEEEKTLERLLRENTKKVQVITNFQKLATSDVAQPVRQEKIVSECVMGHLTPYCRCDVDCKSNIPLEPKEHDPEIAPILLAYNRQCRQSHCFDIDDFTQSRVCPLYYNYTPSPASPVSPYQHPKKPIMMELVNRAIQEYNEKESNVFKYKVLKIEKVNLLIGSMSDTYWMTVKVSNLTLGTPIETFQVHASVCNVYDDREILCCRPKEEAIIGLASCDTCFGLLPEKHITVGKEGGVSHENCIQDIVEHIRVVFIEMADSELKWSSAEGGLILWKRELPGKFLSNVDLWNDDDFLPKGASELHRDAFREIYHRYFRQILQSDGFDIDKYPGDAKAAVYIPYLEFEKEADMLMELANHAIDDYNNRETTVYKYKIFFIEKVNIFLAEFREFFMTVKVRNLALDMTLETLQIHAYKGQHEENIVRLCRKKMAI